MRQLSLSKAFGLTGTLGVITGAISAFNIVVSTFPIGLNAFWSNVLTYWRELFHDTLLAAVLKLAPFHVPAWLHEPIILWTILAGLSVRTIAQARKLARTAQQADIGNVEQWLFGLPAWAFYLVVTLLCLFLLPLVLARLVFGKAMQIKFFHRFELRVFVSFEDEQKAADGSAVIRRYNYRSIVIAQAILLLLVFAIMFLTNAGIP